MPLVTSIDDGRQFDVRGVTDEQALLAVFFREVVYKNRHDLITHSLLQEKSEGEYKQVIKENLVERNNGKKVKVKQIWRFTIETPLN